MTNNFNYIFSYQLLLFFLSSEAEGQETIPKVADAKIDKRTDSSITVSWKTPEERNDITGYRITLRGAEDKKESPKENEENGVNTIEEGIENTEGREEENGEIDNEAKEEDNYNESKDVNDEAEKETDNQEKEIEEQKDLEDDANNGEESLEDRRKRIKSFRLFYSTDEDEEEDEEDENPSEPLPHHQDEEESEEQMEVKEDVEEENEIVEQNEENVVKDDEEMEQQNEEQQNKDQLKENEDEADEPSLLQEITVDGPDVTRATFNELESATSYVVEIFTICGDKESDGVTVAVDTSKSLTGVLCGVCVMLCASLLANISLYNPCEIKPENVDKTEHAKLAAEVDMLTTWCTLSFCNGNNGT